MTPQTPQTPLPSAKDVRELFRRLLGREVDVRTGASMVDPGAGGGALVGVYVDELLRLRAVCLIDVALAAYAGAAIGLLPAPVARESAGSHVLDPELEENAREVLDVVTALLNGDDAPHVRLDAVYAPPVPLPADVAPWVMTYVRRTDLDVSVVGYGTGGFSLLLP